MLYHPIPPLYDEHSKILILGSFPSVKSREQQFFYGHKQNRFWRVMAQVLDCAVPETVGEKKEMLLSHQFQVPRYFIYLTAGEWPRTSTGKVQKFRLVQMAEAVKSNGP